MNFTQSFIENTLMLLLTAGLTGVLVPLLFRSIDQRRNREEKVLEADLARQSKIIDAQVKLLEDLSGLLWEYEILLVAVPYWRQFPERNMYPAALKAYEENKGKSLGRIRAEISKSLRLVPQDVFQELWGLYQQLLPWDLELTQLAASEGHHDRADEWRKLHQYALNDLAKIIDATIDKLASELDLKASKSGQVPTEEA